MRPGSVWRHRQALPGDADLVARLCPICSGVFTAGDRVVYRAAGDLLKVASPEHEVFHKACIDEVAAAVNDDPRPGFEKARASLLADVS